MKSDRLKAESVDDTSDKDQEDDEASILGRQRNIRDSSPHAGCDHESAFSCMLDKKEAEATAKSRVTVFEYENLSSCTDNEEETKVGSESQAIAPAAAQAVE